MPSDYVFYYLTTPLGAAAIVLAIGIPFFLWRFVMGKSFASFGMRPLAAGYVAALLGLVVLNFCLSYLEFNQRLGLGTVKEAARWETVPGWTYYMGVVSLALALPVLGLVAAPIAALFLRRRRLTYRRVLFLLAAFWLLLGLSVWVTPADEWQEANRLEALETILVEVLPGIVAVGLPFFAAILISGRRARVS